MNIIEQTDDFEGWLDGLKDQKAVDKIVQSVARMEAGNFGNSKPVGSGVSECKIDYGPGYRIYYKKTGRIIYLLLCAGTKRTQKKDIKKAIAMADQIQPT